jgi:hypothetical protein
MPSGDSVKVNELVIENKDTRMIVIRTENENLITGLIYKLNYLNLILGNEVIRYNQERK